MSGAFLYVAVGAFCGGAAAGLLTGVHYAIGATLLLFGVLVTGVAALNKKTLIVLLAIVAVSFSLGLLRAQTELRREEAETLPSHIGQSAVVTGRVIEDPDRREKSLHITIEVEKVGEESATGKILAFVPRDEKISYGDTVTVRGEVAEPQPFATDTGHTFDYPGYLRAHGVSAILNLPTVAVVTSGGSTFLGTLYSIKHTFENSLERQYPEPDVALLEGILLGEKHGVPKDLTNDFIQSGLIHVVVLSGYNISIVSVGVFRVVSFLPKTFSYSFGAILMVLFSLMAGAGAATVRALVMGLIALLARYMQRPTLALRALAVAAWAMVVWSPFALLYDSGFILSVLATFGLVTLSPWLETKYSSWRILTHKRLSVLREYAVSTTAVQIYLLPALLYFSGVLSLLSVPANVLALPVIPVVMLMGFLAGILGFFSPLVGLVPAVFSDLLLKWVLLVATTTAKLPVSGLTIGEFPPLILVAVYIPLTLFAARKYITTHQKPRG